MRKTTEIHSLDSGCPWLDSNWTLLELWTEALPLQLSCPIIIILIIIIITTTTGGVLDIFRPYTGVPCK